MSRPIVILVIIVLAVIAAMVGLSTLDTEVAPAPVEKPIANDVIAQ